MIKIKSVSKDKGIYTFEFSGIEAAHINAIRRAIISLVPTLAIENVEIIKNDSAMYDEILAHRLGLVVLSTDLNFYNFRELCDCKGKGCANCTVYFKLKVKGPGYVYAKDLVPSDPKASPVHEKTIIAKLAEGQEIQLEAEAILGRGREHAKWSPAHAWFKKKNQKVGKGTIEDLPLRYEDDKNYLFYLEPWGQLDAKTIMLKALEEINDRLDSLAKALQ